MGNSIRSESLSQKQTEKVYRAARTVMEVGYMEIGYITVTQARENLKSSREVGGVSSLREAEQSASNHRRAEYQEWGTL